MKMIKYPGAKMLNKHFSVKHCDIPWLLTGKYQDVFVQIHTASDDVYVYL